MMLSDYFRNKASDSETCFRGLTDSSVSSPLTLDLGINPFKLPNSVFMLDSNRRIDFLLERGADLSNIVGSGDQLAPLRKQFQAQPLRHAADQGPGHLSDDQTMVDNPSSRHHRPIGTSAGLGQAAFKRQCWKDLCPIYPLRPKQSSSHAKIYLLFDSPFVHSLFLPLILTISFSSVILGKLANPKNLYQDFIIKQDFTFLKNPPSPDPSPFSKKLINISDPQEIPPHSRQDIREEFRRPCSSPAL